MGRLGGTQIEIGSAAGSQATVAIPNGTLTTNPPFIFNPPPGQIVVGSAGIGTLNLGTGTVSSSGTFVIARDATSQGTVALNSAGGTLQSLGTGLTVGQQGDGSLTLSSGAQAKVAGAVKVGQDAGSEGSISVSGPNTTFSGANDNLQMTSITIGQSGQGSMSITEGGAARLRGTLVLGENAGAQGSIVVDGPQSLLTAASGSSGRLLPMTIGAAGKGTMAVTNGATVEPYSAIFVGRDAGGEGSLTVSGGAHLQQAKGLTVGDGGHGTLAINTGGVASSDFVVVGDDAGSQGTLKVDGSNSRLVTGQFSVGNAGNGKLEVTGGGIVEALSWVIGSQTGSIGEATVSGVQSQVKFDTLTVGKSGTGSFKVSEAAATVANALVVGESAGSVGTFTIEGTGPTLTFGPLTVGSGGNGTFNVTSGRFASTLQPAVVGKAQGSMGVVNVSGATSTFINPNSGNFSVGQRGTGELNITAGGSFGTSSSEMKMIIGEFAGSHGTVTVDGPQSSLTLQSSNAPSQPSLIVGQGGTGTFRATGGAKINTSSFYVGYNSGPAADGDGTLELDGPGTAFVALSDSFHPTIIGNQTTGKLSISNGAKLTTGRSYLGYQPNGVGTAEVDGPGSTWTVAQPLELGANGGVGSLSITNGGTVSVVTTSVTNRRNSTIDIQAGTLKAHVDNFGTLINNGTILGSVYNGNGVLSGAGTISGLLTEWGGTIAPGNSPGTLPVGSLEFNLGTFQLEINSAGGLAGGPSGWDLLAVQGGAALNGTMLVELVSLTQANDAGEIFDFNPLEDYQWTFLTAGSGITGFDPNQILIDTSEFTNPFGGRFFVSQVGNALALNYAVPEPSSFVLAALGIGWLASSRRRKKAMNA